jgi:high-affinity nickel-transport protein
MLAYGFGLRHAVDPDHISAIDNTTRRLMSLGKRPVSVGFYFSLGHSTVVILLCLALALSSHFVQSHLAQWKTIGAMVGCGVSTLFLIVIGLINLSVLLSLINQAKNPAESFVETDVLEQRGLVARMLKPLLRLVQHSHQMYLIGFLFGLGFDTATEVGILTLSAQSGQSSIPLGYLLLLPLLFTAGMCLADTIDGILMVGAYGWAYITPERKTAYNIVITAVSVIVAFAVGLSQFLMMFAPHSFLAGHVSEMLEMLNRNLVGAMLIGVFTAIWACSVAACRLNVSRAPVTEKYESGVS